MKHESFDTVWERFDDNGSLTRYEIAFLFWTAGTEDPHYGPSRIADIARNGTDEPTAEPELFWCVPRDVKIRPAKGQVDLSNNAGNWYSKTLCAVPISSSWFAHDPRTLPAATFDKVWRPLEKTECDTYPEGSVEYYCEESCLWNISHGTARCNTRLYRHRRVPEQVRPEPDYE